MQLSYWERKSFISGYDTIIIGAGIVGISAALSLKDLEPNLKILVLERGFLPSGASTKNAGFACFGSVSELLEDFRYMGEEQTLNLVAKRYAGLAALRARTGDAEISFKQSGNYEVFKTGDDEIFETCASFIPILNQKIETITGEKNTFNISDANIPKFGFKDVSHLIFNKCEGKLDTGKMMHKLLTQARSKGIDFYFGAEVRKIDEEINKVVIHLQSDMVIEANKVLVATNGFAAQLLPELEVHPARNQVLVTHPYKTMKFSECFHYDRGYFYWREIDGRILIGGGRNLFPEIESTDLMQVNTAIQNHLIEMIKNWISPHEFPGIDMQWSGILGLGSVKYPIIKSVSQNVTVSVRMGGMGVALGTLAGLEGAKNLLGMHQDQATA